MLPLIFTQCLLVFFFYDRHWEKIITRFSNIASNQINLIKNEYRIYGLNRAKEVASKLNTELSLIEPSKITIERNSFLKKIEKKNIRNRVGENTFLIYDKNYIKVYHKIKLIIY